MFLLCLALSIAWTSAPAQVLPSWNDGAARTRIMEFVRAVTDSPSTTFVPRPERVAVFDNDGTLWSEQPLYFQMMFMIDYVRAAAPDHPEWASDSVIRAVLARDHAALAAMGSKRVLARLAAANAGTTTEAYDRSIRDWLARARHPRFDRPYPELVYQPMRELLAYLRESGFKTYIVSGGSVEFMRPWVEQAYGVPPEQVVGTLSAVTLEMQNGTPVLVRQPRVEFVDDGAGKPVGISRAIGRRPIAAFGNSDGDLQMLQYAAAGGGARLALVVHHTDAEREWAYDRTSRVGKLDRALDEATATGWVVVDMKRDWKRVYPFQ